jgi:antitoxin PrlF
MIVSKITSKAQTTIPLAVRKALGLREGDSVNYVIEEGRVILTRAETAVSDDPFATFTEWAGEADSQAYAGF